MSRSKALDRVADLFAHQEEPPSRNAAFDAYRSKTFVSAVRLHRHLRTLADALVRLDASPEEAVKVDTQRDGRLRFGYEEEGLRRSAFVRPEELRVLFMDPTVAKALTNLGLSRPPPEVDVHVNDGSQ